MAVVSREHAVQLLEVAVPAAAGTGLVVQEELVALLLAQLVREVGVGVDVLGVPAILEFIGHYGGGLVRTGRFGCGTDRKVQQPSRKVLFFGQLCKTLAGVVSCGWPILTGGGSDAALNDHLRASVWNGGEAGAEHPAPFRSRLWSFHSILPFCHLPNSNKTIQRSNWVHTPLL